MSDEKPPPNPAPGALTGLGGLDPLQLLARGLHSVEVSTAGAAGWTPPGVAEIIHLFPFHQVMEMIGHGGMGAVYRARHIELDRIVAIKLLPLEISVDADFGERFRREARVMAKLNHPNIVSVFDFGQTAEGHLYFIMEYVDGASVDDLIHRGGGLPPADALAITEQVCDALAYAHAEGVVHRDVKPANVLVDRHGHVKVADFGLVRLIGRGGAEERNRTLTGVIVGTPDYMAPEQKKGLHADHRADIYALGVTLYEMLCGETPQGAFELPSVRCGLDRRINGIISKALAQQPEKRYQSTAEIKSAVVTVRPSVVKAQQKRARHDTGKIPATAAAEPGAISAIGAIPVSSAPPAPPARVPSRAGRAAPILAAILFLAAAGGALFHFFGGHRAKLSASSELWENALRDPSLAAPHGGISQNAAGLSFTGKGSVIFAKGPERDGAVRFLVPFSPKLEALKVVARSGTGRYQGFLTEDGKGADCQIFNGASTGIDSIQYAPLTQPLREGEPCEMETRIVGTVITLKVNGRLVARGEDAALASGGFGLLWQRDEPLTLSALEVLDLDQPAIELSKSTEPWQNALRDISSGTPHPGVERNANGLVFQSKGSSITFAPGPKRDGAVRFLAPFSAKIESLKIVARHGTSRYQGFLTEDGKGADCQIFNGASTGIDSIRYFPLEESLHEGDLCELELRLVGKQITLKVNGHIAAQGEDAALAAGDFGLLWLGSGSCAVTALEFLDLDREASGSAPDASGS